MPETVSEWNSGGILESDERDPNHMDSDLEGFNCGGFGCNVLS